MSTVMSTAQVDAIRRIKKRNQNTKQDQDCRLQYVRFDPNGDIVESTARLLRQITEKVGPIEYRELEDGAWCIRTIPQDHRVVKLAALGASFRLAAKRMLVILRVME